MKPPLPNLTREDIQAALFGFGVARQEIAMREERFREYLDAMNGTKNLHKSHHKRLIQAEPDEELTELPAPIRVHDTAPGEVPMEYWPDGQAKYRTDSQGRVKVSKRTGLPYRNVRFSPEMKKKLVKQAEIARAGKVAKREQRQQEAASVQMEFWPDGSEKFIRNTDGSVRLTRFGKPWKRVRSEVARQSAYKSHEARGVGHARAAGG